MVDGREERDIRVEKGKRKRKRKRWKRKGEKEKSGDDILFSLLFLLLGERAEGAD